VLYEAGRGVPADAARAADFYERAALAGHADAMVRLGVLLHDGRGVEADPEAARQWLQRAAGLGQPHAHALLDAMD
jgi:TPR repeat protein